MHNVKPAWPADELRQSNVFLMADVIAVEDKGTSLYHTASYVERCETMYSNIVLYTYLKSQSLCMNDGLGSGILEVFLVRLCTATGHSRDGCTLHL